MKRFAAAALTMVLCIASSMPVFAAKKGTVPVADPAFGAVGDVGEIGDLTAGNILTTNTILATIQQEVPSMGFYYVYSSSTDLNGLLGKPGYYIGKADFSDSNKQQSAYAEELGDGTSLILPQGGTIEVFNNSKYCDARFKYLQTFQNPSLGFLALDQYMYKFSNVLLRVDFDVSQSVADSYALAVSKTLGGEKYTLSAINQ